MMDNSDVEIVLRYGGYWKVIPRTGRKKYECGRQRTIRVDVERSYFVDFCNIVKDVCPWFAGQTINFSYTVLDSIPKNYAPVTNDFQYISMLQKHISSNRKVEMFIVVEDAYALNMPPPPPMRRESYIAADNHRRKSVSVGIDSDSSGDESYPFDEDDQYVQADRESALDDTYRDDQEEVQIENEEVCEDEADDCYPEDDYHSLQSSEDESNCADNVDSFEGAIWDVDTEEPTMELGTKFQNGEQFRLCLRQYCIKHNFEPHLIKNEAKRIIAICKHESCPWRIRATRCRDNVSYEIRVMNNKHTCPGVNLAGNKQASSSWIASKITSEVRENPNITPKEIARNLRHKYNLTIPYHRVWRGREQARAKVFGNVESSFDTVPTLKAELLSRNRGSHIQYKLEDDNAFQRMFVSFKACIDGFKAGCRPFIGLDACHLRGKYLGMLMSATALDGNNGLFPIAFAVVESESGPSWQWFLENLNEALGGDVDHLSIISDQEKGLKDALKVLWPQVEHRVCMRHYWKNFKKNFPGDFYERVVWSAARAFSIGEYEMTMLEMKGQSEEAWKYLKQNDYIWSRVQFQTQSKNHYITNNVSESFNAWILESRSLPCVDLIDSIRHKMMVKMDLRRRMADRWKGDLVPMAERYVQDISKNCNDFIVRRANNSLAEVESPYERREVDLHSRNYSCKRWQLTGLPCIHAAAVICSMRYPKWSDYVDECYHVSRFKVAYALPIYPLPSKDQWRVIDKGFIVGPPHATRPRGRPKKKRVKGRDEIERGKKSRRVHQCKRCGGWGHHRNTCKNPINLVSQTEHNIGTQTSSSSAPTVNVTRRGRGGIGRSGIVATKRGKGSQEHIGRGGQARGRSLPLRENSTVGGTF